MSDLQLISSKRANWNDAAVSALILAGILAVFWPVLSADFVWDDKIIFHDTAWFRGEGDLWQMLLHGFGEWTNYFRPLGLTLFFFEARLFGADAMPFHAVSLALHVANAFLLSRLARAWYPDAKKPQWVAAFAMLCYGLHPTLIEPVSWIAAQCDLLVTFVVFVGLLVNVRVEHTGLRVALVGTFCLLGLLVKESAAAFPVLIVLSDWFTRRPRGRSFSLSARRLVLGNAASYALLAVAVLVYLAMRHATLGGAGFSMASPSPVRYVQTVAFLYLKYWQLVISPATTLSPIHTGLTIDLGRISAVSAMYCLGAVLLLSVGMLCAIGRSAIGILILGVTASVVPVLHLLPVEFDESLYHERYAIIAIAFFAGFFPTVLNGIAVRIASRVLRVAALTLSGAWLIVSVATARAVVPMWKNDIVFWQWAARAEPSSVLAMDHLMAAYIEVDRLPEARRVATVLLQKQTTCITCLLNIAYLAIRDGDEQQAAAAVERAGMQLARTHPSQLQAFEYIVTIGDLRQLQNDPAAAEAAYRDAIATDPLNPDGYFDLALLLARQKNRSDEAQAAMQSVKKLSAPDELGKRVQIFEQVAGPQSRKAIQNPN